MKKYPLRLSLHAEKGAGEKPAIAAQKITRGNNLRPYEPLPILRRGVRRGED